MMAPTMMAPTAAMMAPTTTSTTKTTSLSALSSSSLSTTTLLLLVTLLSTLILTDSTVHVDAFVQPSLPVHRRSVPGLFSTVKRQRVVAGPPKDTRPDYENIHGPLGKFADRVFMTVFRTKLAEHVGIDSSLPKVCVSWIIASFWLVGCQSLHLCCRTNVSSILNVPTLLLTCPLSLSVSLCLDYPFMVQFAAKIPHIHWIGSFVCFNHRMISTG